MSQQKLTFLSSLKILFARIFSGRVHFPNKWIGKTLSMEDGKKFKVIRHLKIDPKLNSEKFAAIFKIRFKFSSLPLAVNKRLSLFPTPFLIAKSGFRNKIWAVSEDGYFQGIYEWASNEYARSYPKSFIFKIMTKRSLKNTLSYEIIPGMRLLEYIDNLFK